MCFLPFYLYMNLYALYVLQLSDCIPVCYQSDATQRVLITVLYDDL